MLVLMVKNHMAVVVENIRVVMEGVQSSNDGLIKRQSDGRKGICLGMRLCCFIDGQVISQTTSLYV